VLATLSYVFQVGSHYLTGMEKPRIRQTHHGFT
jgi:hypothetical protein